MVLRCPKGTEVLGVPNQHFPPAVNTRLTSRDWPRKSVNFFSIWMNSSRVRRRSGHWPPCSSLTWAIRPKNKEIQRDKDKHREVSGVGHFLLLREGAAHGIVDQLCLSLQSRTKKKLDSFPRTVHLYQRKAHSSIQWCRHSTLEFNTSNHLRLVLSQSWSHSDGCLL